MKQFAKIIGFAKPYKKLLVVIGFFIICLAGLNQVEPFINRFIVDGVSSFIAKKELIIPKNIIYLFAVLLILRFLKRLVRRIIDYFTNLFAYQYRFALKEEGFSHLIKLSVSFFDKAISGELMSKLDRGTSQLTQIVNNSGLYFIPSLITALIGIGVVASIYWPIALWMILMFIPFTFISYWRFKRNQKLEKREYKLYDRVIP